MDQHVSRIESENGWLFGIKWSMVGMALALCVLLSGCGSLFDTGPDRYNTVQGPRRAPLLNPGGASGAPQQQPEGQPQGQPQPAPTSSLQAPVLPPTPTEAERAAMVPPVADVDAEVAQMEAAYDQSQSDKAAMQAAQAEEGWLPEMGEWFGAEAPRQADLATPPEQAMRPAANPPVDAQAEVQAVPELRMSAEGTQVTYGAPQPVAALGAEASMQSEPLPEPPVIEEPAAIMAEPVPVESAPVQATAESAPMQTMVPLQVPAAPSVQAAPQAVAAHGLTPPDPYAQGHSYLPESRYARRRY